MYGHNIYDCFSSKAFQQQKHQKLSVSYLGIPNKCYSASLPKNENKKYTNHYFKMLKHALIFFFFFFLRPHLQHVEVPGLEVESKLQLLAYTISTATWDPSHVCNLHHSSWQRWILNPLSKARDQICNLMDTSQICFC